MGIGGILFIFGLYGTILATIANLVWMFMKDTPLFPWFWLGYGVVIFIVGFIAYWISVTKE